MCLQLEGLQSILKSFLLYWFQNMVVVVTDACVYVQMAECWGSAMEDGKPLGLEKSVRGKKAFSGQTAQPASHSSAFWRPEAGAQRGQHSLEPLGTSP